MLYDNSYNRSIAEQLAKINRQHIEHSDYIGGSKLNGSGYSDSDSDNENVSTVGGNVEGNVEGGNGFAAGTHNDTGVGSTLGATALGNKGGIEATDMVGGKVVLNTEHQTLMGSGDDCDRNIGAGDCCKCGECDECNERQVGGSFWDSIKSGFKGAVNTVGNVVGTVKKIAPIVSAIAPVVGMINPGVGAALGVASKLAGGKKRGRKAKGGRELVPVDNMKGAFGFGENAAEKVQQQQQDFENVQAAFGGKKISGPILKFIEKISPHLKLGKETLEKYDRDEKISIPKLLFDVYQNLSGSGKTEFDKLDGVQGAGLLGDVLGAIGLGKAKNKGSGNVDGGKLKKLFPAKPSKKLLNSIFRQKIEGSGLFGTIGGLVDGATGLLGLGEPAFDKGVKEELANLPKPLGLKVGDVAMGGKKKTLKDRLIKGGQKKVDEEVKEEITGGKKISVWAGLVKKIMKEKGFKKMSDAIKHIKDNNLYKKK